MVLWLAACVCAFQYARPIWGEGPAAYLALLTGCGPGFIMYVGQPMSYLAGYALIIVLLFLFERIAVSRQEGLVGGHLLYGGVLGLGSMVYDMFPLYILLIVYAFCRRSPVRWLMLSFAVSLAIYFGFVLLVQGVLKVTVVEANSRYIGMSLANIGNFVRTATRLDWYNQTLGLASGYVRNLGCAFFVAPLVLALLGVLFGSNPRQVRLAALLLAPSFAVQAFFHFGGTELADMPRFVYIAYPAVYLLAAIFVSEARSLAARQAPWLPAGAVPALLLGPAFILSNIDALGHPPLYYLFYFVRPGYW